MKTEKNKRRSKGSAKNQRERKIVAKAKTNQRSLPTQKKKKKQGPRERNEKVILIFDFNEDACVEKFGHQFGDAIISASQELQASSKRH